MPHFLGRAGGDQEGIDGVCGAVRDFDQDAAGRQEAREGENSGTEEPYALGGRSIFVFDSIFRQS